MGDITAGQICDQWLSRGSCPMRVSALEPSERAGVRIGDILTWSDARRAYVTPRGDFCVMAEYVRRNWLIMFSWAPAEQGSLAI